MNNKRLAALLAVFIVCAGLPAAGWSSPWAQNEGYWNKTGGKFAFGLKHTLFSWMTPWAEAHDPQHETPWTGFCVGIGKAVVYTATGLIQLVTFPIPVDFPNVGLGMHVPANHEGGSTGKKSAPAAAAAPAVAVAVPAATAAAVSAEPPKTSPAVVQPAVPAAQVPAVAVKSSEPASAAAPQVSVHDTKETLKKIK